MEYHDIYQKGKYYDIRKKNKKIKNKNKTNL